MPDIEMREIKKDISRLLDRIFMERRVAYDLELDVKEIDDFIVAEGVKLKEKYEKMSVEEMIDLMLNEIVSYLDSDTK